ncbi:MAG: peroxidase [Ignavibacteria bacterium]|nr:MAG: peroxidase [Ignavibacteria bacterium]
MSWIKEIDEAAAEGKLKEIYSEIAGARGKVSNIMKVHSLMPETMRTHLNLYLSIMFDKNSLSRELKELIAVVVSVCNNCEYCVNHHAVALNHYWKDDKKIDDLINDYRSMDLPVKVFAVLSYAEKLTLHPHKIMPADIENLRMHGYTDEEILNINLIVSYFNFVNRIVMGLGVEFSEEELRGYNY